MKKTKLAIALTSAAFASSAMATNGTNMIGIGAQSMAMGGAGIATFFGAENLLTNPALIGKSEGTELIFGGTIFLPAVETTNNTHPLDNNTFSNTSDAELFVVPSAAFSSRINNNMTYGIGMFGTSGMGVDYRKDKGMFYAQSALQVLRFVPSLAFNTDNTGIGFSPIIQYGALDINYRNPFDVDSQGNDIPVGYGMAQGLGMGYAFGGYIDPMPGLTLAAAYNSSIDMDYKGQLTTAAAPFENLGFTLDSDHLEQPAEMKIGASLELGKLTFTADARRIMWGEAKGYKEFGWENQNVTSVGAKWNSKGYWLAAGYNKGTNPVKEQDGDTQRGAVMNFFNNTFFPATTESHVTLGGGFPISKKATVEGAFVYAPEVTTNFSTQALAEAGTNTNDPAYSETKHSQSSMTMMVRYNFD